MWHADRSVSSMSSGVNVTIGSSFKLVEEGFLYYGCFNVFCDMWVCVCMGFVMCVCVGVLIKCVLLFAVFLYCFVYVYLFLFVTGVRTTATEWKLNSSK
jgi:hypothetical protein